MPTTKQTIAITLGGAALAAGGVLAAGALDDANDPVEVVGAVAVGQVEAGAAGAATQGSNQPVVALEELSGTLFQEEGDDVDDLAIGGVELDFGPESWVLGAPATEDYDGDGRAEALRDELRGMVGADVTVLVRFDDDRDDADVYVVNDLPYRDTSGGPAPWEAAPEGELATREQLIAAAEGAVGAGARLVELEQDDDGAAGWEAEVLDAQGREHNVILSATGEVLAVEQDD